jgi:hypothetical protein
MEVLSGRIILRPVDLERSLRFYGGYLEITGRAASVDVDKVSLWLQVPDLAEAHQRLSAADVDITDPPERKPWGLLEMWIRDPDGLSIVVVEVPEDHPLRRRA